MTNPSFAFTTAALDFLETLPPKIRKQVIKKARALHTTPYPQGSKKLHDVFSDDGHPVYRERSGDYRILYVVHSNPDEVLILDIDHRKDIYRMPKTKSEPADPIKMKEAGFDAVMSKALEIDAPQNDEDNKPVQRLSAYPSKQR